MAEEAKASIEREKADFAGIRARQKHFASILVPLVLLICTAWTAMLSFVNVRQRGAEIGILRAIGFDSGQVLRLFLSRSAAMGICGGLAGYAAGIFLGLLTSAGELAQVVKAGLFVFDFDLLALALFVAVAITSAAGGVAALVAAAKDPAAILSEN
jgi:putative ABC transport system permease protein